MHVKWLGVVLLGLLVLSDGSAQAKASHHDEQLQFSAEASGVNRPVPIPNDVLAILKKDKLVRGTLEDEGIPAEKLPLSWFSASAIHLSNDNQGDLIVMGQGRLRGANVITFWVFRYTAHGYQLVLTAPAHDLIVTDKRWKGYREIELISLTAEQVSTVFLRFDGKSYKERKSTLKPIKSICVRQRDSATCPCKG